MRLRPEYACAVSSVALALTMAGGSPVRAETILGALAKAYVFSPDLGQQRAAGRAADENVPRAASALRPTIAATASAGVYSNRLQSPANPAFGLPAYTQKNTTFPRNLGLTVTQTIYNGNRAINGIRQAESAALSSQEQVRLTELMVLSNAATAYMNVLRDTALLALNQSNVRVLREQLSQNQARFKFGEITRTDVSQSEAAVSQGEAAASSADGNLQASLATYRQLIGQPPSSLEPAQPLDRLIPATVDDAIATALKEHPAIQAALHAVDAAALNVKIQEGALLPTVQVQGSAAQAYDANNTPKEQFANFGVLGSVNVPIYDGGLTFANIRQAKEQLSQGRLQVDLQREAIRSEVVASWAGLRTSRANVRSFQTQIRANEAALEGVRQEAKVGQRTTLDVLNAQQTLLNSRTSLIGAQRDQVVQSYGLLAAMGRLSAATLGLRAQTIDPREHLLQVRGKAFGDRMPDGK